MAITPAATLRNAYSYAVYTQLVSHHCGQIKILQGTTLYRRHDLG